MFKCTDCQKVVRRVEDIRNCARCNVRGTSSSIPASHSNSDWLTPAIIGYALGGGFSGHSHSAPVDDTPAFAGGGGDTVGAGAGSSWSDDSRSSSSDSSSSSSDSSSSSSDSGSSDSGSSSSSDS